MLYPNFLDLAALKYRNLKAKRSRRAVDGLSSGDHHSPFRGHGLDFDAVREYVAGDDIRRIDWRVTARKGSPHLKIFKEDRERTRLFVVDMNKTMRFGTKNTFKSVQAAHVAAFLGWQGIKSNDKVGACLFGDVPKGIAWYPPKKTEKSFLSILKMLSEPPTEDHRVPFADTLPSLDQAAPTGSLIYIITDFFPMHLDQDQEIGLSRLTKKSEVIFISIEDPLDAALYPFGELTFSSDLENRFYANTKNEKGRTAYAEEWKENRKKLHALTAKFKVPLIELSTQSDLNGIFN